ncbi:MAG: Gfo/Idh/MocA family oxidoreductase [Planctomycetota bacterium]
MAKIKHGIIGTGGMAAAHARNFAAIPGVETVACYDVLPDRAQRFAETHGIRHAVGSVDDLLDACDSVSIVTPDAFHAELSLKTLAAGRHLLCEKPLATTLADARKVAKAARAANERGVTHLINFSYRDASAFQKAIRIAAEGKLGRVRHVTGKYLQAWLSTKVWGSPLSEGWLWRQQIPPGGGPAAGGTLGDIGCHILDFTTAVAGDVKALRCLARTFPKVHPDTGDTLTSYGGKKFNANDSVLIDLELADGQGVGTVEATRWATGHPNQVALGVYGTEGAVEIDLERSYTILRTCLGKARHKAEWKDVEVKPTPNNYARFVRSIKTGKNDQADLVRGAQVQAYLDACERSAESGGKRVTIRKHV